jgi:hypothetical protein
MAATSQCPASFRFPVKGFMTEEVIWAGDLLGARFADSKDPFYGKISLRISKKESLKVSS